MTVIQYVAILMWSTIPGTIHCNAPDRKYNISITLDQPYNILQYLRTTIQYIAILLYCNWIYWCAALVWPTTDLTMVWPAVRPRTQIYHMTSFRCTLPVIGCLPTGRVLVVALYWCQVPNSYVWKNGETPMSHIWTKSSRFVNSQYTRTLIIILRTSHRRKQVVVDCRLSIG
jgi:hypothetical protein